MFFSVLKFFWRVCRSSLKIAILLFGQEVLMRKKTEERMKAAAHQETQFRMNEFLSVISHDIKTPLTSIKGNLQLMRRKLKNYQGADTNETDEMKKVLTESRDLLERTDQQINRLTLLVNSLLESSRISANTMDLLFELCELNNILNEVTQDKRYVPEARKVHLELPAEKIVLVMGDVSRIKQVIMHYLSNAHKYSEIDRVIEVTLRENGKEARIQVKDEGQGIPASEHKHIWDRFYRVPDVQTFNGSEVGLGLGLHICRTIVEQHRGKVGVQSTPGAGSIFWFTIPLVDKSLHIL